MERSGFRAPTLCNNNKVSLVDVWGTLVYCYICTVFFYLFLLAYFNWIAFWFFSDFLPAAGILFPRRNLPKGLMKSVCLNVCELTWTRDWLQCWGLGLPCRCSFLENQTQVHIYKHNTSLKRLNWKLINYSDCSTNVLYSLTILKVVTLFPNMVACWQSLILHSLQLTTDFL